jgi:hypothetical protein
LSSSDSHGCSLSSINDESEVEVHDLVWNNRRFSVCETAVEVWVLYSSCQANLNEVFGMKDIWATFVSLHWQEQSNMCILHTVIFWVSTAYSVIGSYRHFRGTYCLHHQSGSVFAEGVYSVGDSVPTPPNLCKHQCLCFAHSSLMLFDQPLLMSNFISPSIVTTQ